MMETIKVLLVLVVENMERFTSFPDIPLICLAVFVEVNFGLKRTESNFKQIDGFSIGTILIDHALFVFLAHDRFEL